MEEASRFPSVSSPPSWADRFRSDDLDEVRAFVARSVGEHSRVAHRGGPIGWELAWLAGRNCMTGWGRMAVDKTIRAAVVDPTVHLLVPAGNQYLVGRRSIEPDCASVMYLAPGWEFTRRGRPGLIVALSVKAGRLADEIAARAPELGQPVFPTQRLDIDAAGHSALEEAIRGFVDWNRPGASQLEQLHGDAEPVSAIAGLLLRQAARARAEPVASTRTRRLEDWIRAHLDEPITVGRLCEVAGVGERSLQKAFEARRGMSPMRFVTERRLAEARRRLESGRHQDDVTRVAVGLGFHHMGRFAKEYRRAFGEPPSQTRSRSIR